MPEWFTKLDTDRDGQIGLYEWKKSGLPLGEFKMMDRNDDGFITVEEMLWYMGREKDRLAKTAEERVVVASYNESSSRGGIGSGSRRGGSGGRRSPAGPGNRAGKSPPNLSR